MALDAREVYVDEGNEILAYLHSFHGNSLPIDERYFQDSVNFFTQKESSSLPKFNDWRTVHSGGEKYRVSERLGSLIDGLVGRGLVKRVGEHGIKPTQGENCLTLRE